MSDEKQPISQIVVPPTASERARMSEVIVPDEEIRVSTGVPGLDQCLAETDDSPPGLPLGVSVLLSGMPGGGKSTIATYFANATGGPEGQSLYGHGEERAISVRKRWDRLGMKGVDPWMVPMREVEKFLEHVRDIQVESPLHMVVADSVQTLSLDGKRHHDDQFEAAEMIVGTVCGAGGSVILVNHVSKSGDTHAGSGQLSHLVDVHLHVTVDARRGERWLEFRKNRYGRAGYRVQLYVGPGGLSVGVPTAMGQAAGGGNSAAERACAAAMELFMQPDPKFPTQGMFLTGYHFDLAQAIDPTINPGSWRAGYEMAARRLERDGFDVQQERRAGRGGYFLKTLPGTVAALPEGQQ